VLPTGPCVLGVRFRRDGNGATATIVVDDEPVGSAEIPFAMRVVSSVGGSVGYDHGMPVSDRYEGTFPFEGVLQAVDIELLRASRHEERDVAGAEGRSALGRQ
jgi:arylsulfatase